jgi:hypothetical protein
VSAADIMPEPDPQQMLLHLEHLFDGFLDGCQNGLIELAWSDGKDGRLRHAAIFGTDQLDEIVEKAVSENRKPGQNVYIGIALRKPETPPFGRCNDEDFLALTAFYADLDDEGVAEAAKPRYQKSPPTAVVVTGRHPHLRAQLLWRQEAAETDRSAWRYGSRHQTSLSWIGHYQHRQARDRLEKRRCHPLLNRSTRGNKS